MYPCPSSATLCSPISYSTRVYTKETQCPLKERYPVQGRSIEKARQTIGRIFSPCDYVTCRGVVNVEPLLPRLYGFTERIMDEGTAFPAPLSESLWDGFNYGGK